MKSSEKPTPRIAGGDIVAGEVRQAAFRLSAQIGTAKVLGLALSVPAQVFNAWVLGPGNYGLLRIAHLIQKYSAYADCGAKFSVSREVPILLGRGDPDEARVVSELVLAWIACVSLVVTAVLWLFFWGGATFGGLLTAPNMVLLTVLLLVNRGNTFLANYVRAHGDFDALGTQFFITSIIPPLISVPAILFWGVTGGLLAQLVVVLLIVGALLRFAARSGVLRLRPVLNLRKTVRLLRVGLLLYGSQVSEGTFGTIELTLLAFFASVDGVGLYGFAINGIGASLAVLAGVRLVADRAMLMERGVRGRAVDHAAFARFLERPLVAYLLYGAWMLGLTYVVLDGAVQFFLPRFAAALPVARVLVVAQLLYLSTGFPRSYFSASDQLGSRLSLSIGGLLLNVIVDCALLYAGYGIVAVALGSACSYAVYVIVTLAAASRSIYGRAAVGVKRGFQVLAVSAVAGLIVEGLALTSAPGLGIQTELGRLLWEGVFMVAKGVTCVGLIYGTFRLVFREYDLAHEVGLLRAQAIRALSRYRMGDSRAR